MSPKDTKPTKTIGPKKQPKLEPTPVKSIGRKPPAQATERESANKRGSDAPLTELTRQKVNARLQGSLSAEELGRWARSEWTRLSTEAHGADETLREVLLTLSGHRLAEDDLISVLAKLSR
jgi:hypothetical protein